MSSMRNAVTRRPHKERSQPGSRAKWGILEKHKDYSLRAQDYNLKKKKLSQLSAKARERNPDEFAFGMLSADKARQGKHGQTGDGAERLSHDAVKLLKSQDAGYMRVAAGRGRKEVQRLEEVVGLGVVMKDGAVGKRVVFVDGKEEGTTPRGKKRNISGEVLREVDEVRQNEGLIEEMGAAGNDAGMQDADENTAASKPQSKKALEKARAAVRDMQAERKRRKRLAEARANKLEALKKRQREIMAAADQLELQRAKMARSVGGVNKNGVKFKIRERRK